MRSSKSARGENPPAGSQRDLAEAVAKLKILAHPIAENVAVESYLELCDIMLAALARGPLSDHQLEVIREHFERATAALLDELETWRPLTFSSSQIN